MPFVLAFALALVLTPVAARVAKLFGLVDAPAISDGGTNGTTLKIHARPVPVLGGAAVVVAVLGATAMVGRAPVTSIVAAVAVAFGSGLADDARPIPPPIRVQFQILAGLLLAAGGFRFVFEGALGIAALVALTVACTNAVNLIDGQDGLAAGLGAIAALGLGMLADNEWRQLATATAGSLTGFLVWNRPPARIFLGNGGAYAVGVVLAALAAAVTDAEGVRGMLAAASCLGVFAFELGSTVTRRLSAGVPLANGDRRHGYDVLAARLGSRTRSTLAVWAMGAVTAVVGVMIGS
jgi:UDP-GlcNAc:undecaprenyl-phosphate/decaprenyl-phosphate GlcNAc-1-phosphate transferase